MAIEPDNRSWLPAQWDAPAWVKAGTTTRHGGNSLAPYDNLNLAFHVGDVPETVRDNRAFLGKLLDLPSEPVWLDQVHGKHIINNSVPADREADGIFMEQAGVVCVIMTADCVPLLLCNNEGTRVAAIHAGWRGICAGIISEAISLFADSPQSIQVWIGPHISPDNYEVGNDVRDACLETRPNLEQAFTANTRGRWQADLEMLVRYDLALNNVNRVYSIDQCNFSHPDDYYSFRRDGQTGRNASMIWIDK